LVADLWGSAFPTEEHDPDVPNCVFSCSKVVTSVTFSTLADRGLMNYEDKVTKYWPEFGQNGKENITVQDVMRHVKKKSIQLSSNFNFRKGD